MINNGPAIWCSVKRVFAPGQRLFATHFDGTVGGQDAIDEYGHTINWGGLVLSSTQVKFGATSLRIPAGSTLSVSSTSSDYDLGTGDFVMQGHVWMDNTVLPSVGSVIPIITLTDGGSSSYEIFVSTNDRIGFRAGGSIVIPIGGFAYGPFWIFTEITRVSGTIYIYIAGSLLGSFADSSTRPMNTIKFSSGVPGDTYFDDWELARYPGAIPPYTPALAPFYTASGPAFPFVFPP